jgi:hypothetical protein
MAEITLLTRIPASLYAEIATMLPLRDVYKVGYCCKELSQMPTTYPPISSLVTDVKMINLATSRLQSLQDRGDQMRGVASMLYCGDHQQEEDELENENGEDEYDEFSHAVAQICFGYQVSYQELRKQLYVGRRWFRNKSHETKYLSQPLSEAPPSDGKGGTCYTEITSMEDFNTLSSGWEKGMMFSDCSVCHQKNYVCKCKTRPKGLRAWKGPGLKYHLSDALDDLMERLAVPKDLRLSIHYTGFLDEAGDDVVLGFKFGGLLPASFFKRIVQDPSSDIIPVHFSWVTRVLMDCCGESSTEVDWPTAPANHAQVLEQALKKQVAKVLTSLLISFEAEEVSFKLVFNGNC